MKQKMRFLALTLFIMGAASVNAQVLVGGINAGEEPDPSALLELKSNNSGLLLPQVKLEATDDKENLTNPEEGMLVCNVEGALKTGVYYWNGNQWTLYIEF
jgi:hypothetical protein